LWLDIPLLKGGPPRRFIIRFVLKLRRPGRLARLSRKSRNIVRGAVARLRHPKGMTCLRCGFLGFNDEELVTSSRILLSDEGSAEHPPLNEVRCTRALWVDYDLRNFEDARKGIFHELHKRRRPCEGFLRYTPGLPPSKHWELLRTKRERLDKMIYSAAGLISGFILTLLGQILLKRWGLK